MSAADIRRQIGCDQGTLTQKIATHLDPFEQAPKAKAASFKCTTGGAEKPCWMAQCHARAAQAAMPSPDDVLSGPGITIWHLPPIVD